MKIMTVILCVLSAFLLFRCATPEVPVEASATPQVTETASPQRPVQLQIAVRTNDAGVGEFYDKLTGDLFSPRGYNYTHVMPLTEPCLVTGISYHSTFNVGVYDAGEAAGMLAALQTAQYNVVRVFLNPECMTDREGNLLPAYITNLADFLSLAHSYGQMVIVTTDLIPSTRYGDPIQEEADIWWQNTQYLYADEMALEKKFWRDFITALRAQNAPLDAILAYELRNELYFHPDFAPLNQELGTITAANNQTYDMALQADKERMAAESVVYWIAQMRETIQALDPIALVTLGFFAPEPFATPSRSAIFDSELDFVDLHMYPQADVTLADYVTYFGLDEAPEKPLLMGEFGVVDEPGTSLAKAASKLQSWQVESCRYNFTGWLLWTWSTEEGVELSLRDDGTLFDALSPTRSPDPCAPTVVFSRLVLPMCLVVY